MKDNIDVKIVQKSLRRVNQDSKKRTQTMHADFVPLCPLLTGLRSWACHFVLLASVFSSKKWEGQSRRTKFPPCAPF